jgi:hypothetical protein
MIASSFNFEFFTFRRGGEAAAAKSCRSPAAANGASVRSRRNARRDNGQGLSHCGLRLLHNGKKYYVFFADAGAAA